MPMIPNNSSNFPGRLIIDTTAATPIITTVLEPTSSIINLQVKSTAQTCTVTVEARLNESADFVPFASFDLNTISKTENGVIGSSGIYQLSVIAIPFIRVTVSNYGEGQSVKVWMYS